MVAQLSEMLISASQDREIERQNARKAREAPNESESTSLLLTKQADNRDAKRNAVENGRTELKQELKSALEEVKNLRDISEYYLT
jgi:hypothetical protein